MNDSTKNKLIIVLAVLVILGFGIKTILKKNAPANNVDEDKKIEEVVEEDSELTNDPDNEDNEDDQDVEEEP